MERVNIRDFYNTVVVPEIFARLDQLFPEFDWKRKGNKWETGPSMSPDLRELYGKPGRAACKPESPYQFIYASGEGISWTKYITGGIEPRGDEFRRAVVELCRLCGIDHAPISREPVSDAERAAWAALQAERSAEAKRVQAQIDREVAAEEARKIQEARACVGTVAAQVRDGRDQTPIERYHKHRGRAAANFPGGIWPDGAIFGGITVGKRKRTAIVVPALDADWNVVACQRIFVDELGQPAPIKMSDGPNETRKAALGVLGGAAARIGHGFPDGVLVLCEGWETGVAVHEATGWTVWPCVSTSGLRTVRIADADLAEISAIVVAGDLDREHKARSGKPFRPGQEAARDAADFVRTEYAKPAAVALPAHAIAPGLVTADELPTGDAKSVDWEDVVNAPGLGLAVVRRAFDASRAAATTERQGPLPWEPEPDRNAGPAGDRSGPRLAAPGFKAFVPSGGRDRAHPQWDDKTQEWYRWTKDLDAWVLWDDKKKRWREPFAPVLSADNLRSAHEYLLARHTPERLGDAPGGLRMITTGGRCYLYDGTKWVEYAEATAEIVRGDVRRYFAGHCKPKTNRDGAVTHYVPCNISKSEVDSITSAVIDETRTVLPHEAFRFQFWQKPNVIGGQISREHATWQRVVDRPEDQGLPSPESVTPIRNGLIDLDAWTRDADLVILPHSPLFFSTGCVEAELPETEARAALERGGVDALEAYAWTLCPEWKTVLEHAFGDDDPLCAPTTIRELHKIFGYHLTCSMDFHQANICWHVGPPKCGKSTILKVNAALMGPSNCVSSRMEDMADSFHFDLWIGKRVAHLPDLAVSGRMDKIALTETLKMLGSSEPMSVNRKHIKGIPNWRNMAKLFVSANQMPALIDPTLALPRRSMAFLYKNIIKNEDNGLERRITQPRSLAGVQLLALVGLHRLHREGVVQPQWSVSLIEDLREQGSRYPGFIEACLTIDNDDPKVWLATEDLTRCFAAYSAAEGSNFSPPSSQLIAQIGGLLVQHGWVSVKKNQRGRQYGYKGLMLSPDGQALLNGQSPGGKSSGAGDGGYDNTGFLSTY